MGTLNPGYYNNTTCSTGGVQMPNSDSEVLTLTPVCNPIDQQLMNTIISYLISNDIFILNQSTDTQQDPGLFNIVSYGQAYNFRSVMFELLNTANPRILKSDLKLRNTTINNLGDYYGATWTNDSGVDFTIILDNILLKGLPVFDITVLPNTELNYLATIDGNGLLNRVLLSNVQTKIPTLQQVCNAGNSTTTRISLADAINDSDLVTYGQMVNHLADIISSSPDVLTIINELIDLVADDNPIVQQILDSLADYIPLTQKGALNGVLTLDLTSRLTESQWPLMDLDYVCNVSNIATTTIVALPATTGNELVTLNQLNLLVDSGVGTLDQVLTQGNESTYDMVLAFDDYNTTHGYYQSKYTYDNSPDQVNTLTLAPAQIILSALIGAQSSIVELQPSLDLPFDRLTANTHIVITENDFGHDSISGISIDADTVDTYHATDFVLLVDFPVNVTGLVLNNVLIFDGTNWIPGTASSGSFSLTYFAETTNTNGNVAAVWYPKTASHDLFLKVPQYKNVYLGSFMGATTGLGNLIHTTLLTGPTTTGNYNVAFGISSGTISGSSNYIFGSLVTISAASSGNFIVDTSSPLGTSNAATNNIVLKHSTKSNSVYTFAGVGNTLIQNVDLNFGISSITNSLLLHNTSLNLYSDNAVAIKAYESSINGDYLTLINATSCTIGANRSFVSGLNITATSYANTAFGVYPTVETNVNSTTLVAISDRAFFIGAGTITTPFNPITVWKSGEIQIGGALLLGYSDGTKNETGLAITGMIRQNNGYLEIYRGGWTNVLTTALIAEGAEAAWSIIRYIPLTDTPSTYSITGSSDAVTNDYKIRPGSTQSVQPNTQAVVLGSDGLMTFVAEGVFQVNINLRLTITNVIITDRIQIEAAINGDLVNPVYIYSKNLYEGTSDVSINFSFLESFDIDDTLQLYIHYKDGTATHEVTPNVRGTSVSIAQIADAKYLS